MDIAPQAFFLLIIEFNPRSDVAHIHSSSFLPYGATVLVLLASYYLFTMWVYALESYNCDRNIQFNTRFIMDRSRAKIINVFRAWIGAQLTICAQK